MKKRIYPAIIARNKKEFNKRYRKVKGLSRLIHVDVSDGRFVKSRSMWFDFKLPNNNFYVHLMVRNPEIWIKQNLNKVKGVVVHVESSVDLDYVVEFAHKAKKKIGLAINPGTSIGVLKKYLNKVDFVVVMTVEPGFYGSRFIPECLDKVKELRRFKRDLDIEVDGGINLETIRMANDAGANRFIVGSFLQKASDAGEAFRELEKALKS